MWCFGRPPRSGPAGPGFPSGELPGAPWARWYQVVVDTTLDADPGAHDDVVHAGDAVITLAPRSLLLPRADHELWNAT